MLTIRDIRDIRDDERAWANAIYRDIVFQETPPGALQLVAEADGARVGLGRLVELEPGVTELGGIWTAEAARGRGVARTMVDALLARAPAGRLWCIPFAHLGAFYQSCGFAPIARPYPATISARVGVCTATTRTDVLVLARD